MYDSKPSGAPRCRTTLRILYRDAHYVAVDKPAGLLVHRTRIAEGERDAALQRLRRQVGQKVYPVHRLDRPTSGVLLFGLSAEAARRLGECFERCSIEKTYLAVVRGYTLGEGRIDYPLSDESGKPPREAVTNYRRLDTVELPVPVGRYQTARYSLVQVRPETGRHHQIRKHFAHIFHPVIGDTTHGEGRHNRLFREYFGVGRMLLIATGLRFAHPFDDRPVDIAAPLEPAVNSLFTRLGWAPASLESIADRQRGHREFLTTQGLPRPGLSPT